MSEMSAEPERIAAHAERLADSGESLRDRTADPLRPARLGTAPPAIWFSRRLATLAGANGALGMVRSWGDGLTAMGTSQREAAARYTDSDADRAAGLHGTGPDR